MRNMISGVIGLLWGGSVVVYGITNRPQGSSAYASGRYAALVMGVVLILGGVYYLRKGLKEKKEAESQQN